MKMFAKLARAVHVETPVLSVMFLGYFVLLVATASFIVKHANSGKQASTVTATTAIQGNNTQN